MSIKSENQLNYKELMMMKEIEAIADKQEDVEISHPLLEKMKEMDNIELAKLENVGEKELKQFERKKNQVFVQRTLEYYKDLQTKEYNPED